MMRTAVHDYLIGLQQSICKALETTTSDSFTQDVWARPEGGGGISQYIEQGSVLERAAVLFSHVEGSQLPASATAQRPHLAGRKWEAMGLSLVIHPKNPFAPTTHANVRFFLARKTSSMEEDVFWFGGGMDLTPYYVFEEDAIHFHRSCKQALDPFGEQYYPRFKTWCDEYFYLKHREETRGIGGIFFDDLSEPDFDTSFNIMQSVGSHFVPAYIPILEKRQHVPYSEEHRDFQAHRRGRYVEFNLIYDRGTLFGLQSGGRAESILLSMPPIARWSYQYQPAPDSPEARLYGYLSPRDWLCTQQ